MCEAEATEESTSMRASVTAGLRPMHCSPRGFFCFKTFKTKRVNSERVSQQVSSWTFHPGGDCLLKKNKKFPVAWRHRLVSWARGLASRRLYIYIGRAGSRSVWARGLTYIGMYICARRRIFIGKYIWRVDMYKARGLGPRVDIYRDIYMRAA